MVLSPEAQKAEAGQAGAEPAGKEVTSQATTGVGAVDVPLPAMELYLCTEYSTKQ